MSISFNFKIVSKTLNFKTLSSSLSKYLNHSINYYRIPHPNLNIAFFSRYRLLNRQYIYTFDYPYSTLKAVIPESYSVEDSDTVESIKMLIDKRIRPVIQQDGGDVSFVSFDSQTGFVYVRLSGACVGCVQSDITLKHMIQDMLCHYLDDITAVYNVDENNNVVTGDTIDES